MDLPFNKEEFFEVFRLYNSVVWPMQVVLIGAGLAAAALALAGVSRIVSALLVVLWLWMGMVYHWHFFSAINPAARLFAVLFVAQALLLLWLGWQRRRLHLRWHGNLPGGLAASLIAFALIVYPLLNRVLGHAFTESPTFGCRVQRLSLRLGCSG